MRQLSNKTHDYGGMAMIMMWRLSTVRRSNLPHDTPIVILKDGKEYKEYNYFIMGDILVISVEELEEVFKPKFGTLTLADLIRHKTTQIQSLPLLRSGKYDYELMEISHFVKTDKIILRYLE